MFKIDLQSLFKYLKNLSIIYEDLQVVITQYKLGIEIFREFDRLHVVIVTFNTVL